MKRACFVIRTAKRRALEVLSHISLLPAFARYTSNFTGVCRVCACAFAAHWEQTGA